MHVKDYHFIVKIFRLTLAAIDDHIVFIDSSTVMLSRTNSDASCIDYWYVIILRIKFYDLIWTFSQSSTVVEHVTASERVDLSSPTDRCMTLNWLIWSQTFERQSFPFHLITDINYFNDIPAQGAIYSSYHESLHAYRCDCLTFTRCRCPNLRCYFLNINSIWKEHL